MAWLKAYPIEGDKVAPPNLRKRWDRLRKEAGIVDWPQDGMRHTFATYHYAMHRNEAALQVLMGHTSAKMIHQHYRGLAPKKEAERFWSLSPHTIIAKLGEKGGVEQNA